MLDVFVKEVTRHQGSIAALDLFFELESFLILPALFNACLPNGGFLTTYRWVLKECFFVNEIAPICLGDLVAISFKLEIHLINICI